jgi:hypothetical protein
VFIMFYWMDIITTSHHHIQMSIGDSVSMCWSHLRSSHLRVVNTAQMTRLLETTTPRSAIITGITRPDGRQAVPAAVPVVQVPSPGAAAPVLVVHPIVIPDDVAPLTP